MNRTFRLAGWLAVAGLLGATLLVPASALATDTQDPGGPKDTASVPVETESVPVETRSAPVETESAPVETESAPVETESAPVETECAPVETEVGPGRDRVRSRSRPRPPLPDRAGRRRVRDPRRLRRRRDRDAQRGRHPALDRHPDPDQHPVERRLAAGAPRHRRRARHRADPDPGQPQGPTPLREKPAARGSPSRANRKTGALTVPVFCCPGTVRSDNARRCPIPDRRTRTPSVPRDRGGQRRCGAVHSGTVRRRTSVPAMSHRARRRAGTASGAAGLEVDRVPGQTNSTGPSYAARTDASVASGSKPICRWVSSTRPTPVDAASAPTAGPSRCSTPSGTGPGPNDTSVSSVSPGAISGRRSSARPQSPL